MEDESYRIDYVIKEHAHDNVKGVIVKWCHSYCAKEGFANWGTVLRDYFKAEKQVTCGGAIMKKNKNRKVNIISKEELVFVLPSAMFCSVEEYFDQNEQTYEEVIALKKNSDGEYIGAYLSWTPAFLPNFALQDAAAVMEEYAERLQLMKITASSTVDGDPIGYKPPVEPKIVTPPPSPPKIHHLILMKEKHDEMRKLKEKEEEERKMKKQEDILKGFKHCDWEGCDYMSKQSQNLKKHFDQKHLGLDYACEFCPETFTKYQNWTDHKRKCHFQEWQVLKKLNRTKK